MAVGPSRNVKGINKATHPPRHSSLRPKITQHTLAESTEYRRLAILRAEKTRDQLLVNSVEQSPLRTPPLTGFEHYMHMMHQAGLDIILSQDETDTHKPSNPQRGTVTKGAVTNGATANGTTTSGTLTNGSTTISNTHPAHRTPANAPAPLLSTLTLPLYAPTPPQSQTHYDHPIYTGTTHNPAVFLAILRIASANLPYLNLLSALNHIPNIHPTDPLPVLHPAPPGFTAPQPFLDSTFPWEKKEGDEEVSVAFLPNFYDGGERHAIAFWTPKGDEMHLGQKMLGTAFVTPCYEWQLVAWGLVEYEEDEVGEGVLLKRVGCAAGRWVERDTVEEYEEWKEAFCVAGKAWEERVKLAKGALECPG